MRETSTAVSAGGRSWLSVGIVLVSVVYILIAGWIGTTTIVPRLGWGGGETAADAEADTLPGRFARWDAGYYLSIAEDGYRVNGAERAFFPLYPLVARALSAVSGLPVLWSGLLLSIGCYMGAGWLLHGWLATEYDEPTARWSLLWFCFFPVSFFFVAFYPEALFLLASIGALYAARRGRFVLSGACIAIAGAARPTAFLLAVPYIAEFVMQGDRRGSRGLRFALGGLIAPIGTLGYALWLIELGGSTNPLDMYHANLALNWRMSTTWPWTTMYYGVAAAFLGEGIGRDWFARALAWQDLLYAIFGTGIAVWAWLRLRISLGLLVLASMVFYLSSRGPFGHVFEGMPRHVASIVPLYLMLAIGTLRLPRAIRWVPLGFSAVMLGIMAAWFASGRWVS